MGKKKDKINVSQCLGLPVLSGHGAACDKMFFNNNKKHSLTTINCLAKSTSSELCLSGSAFDQHLYKDGNHFNIISFPNSSMTPRKKLQGLVAATVTPMTPDGQINLSVIGQYVDYLVGKQNIKNIFVNGTTGEGLSLSTQERKQLAEEWVCQGKDKLDHVIIHVGALSLPESQELARHAAAIGASAIAVIAPFFFKPTNKDELVAFLQKVASEAPEVPFYYYHIPPLTGVKIRVEELLDGIKERIPTFQGVKFSDTDLLDLAQCINKNEAEQFEFLYGVDEYIQLLGAKNQSDVASLCEARPCVSAEVSVSYRGISQFCHQARFWCCAN
ncbi:N-acetylneuraminate lyase isoform X2 [Dryobates pubescens]|uniref:N-acetylneuraminate lyase isoform X2 n=1 Tax=Dryobates pubescens TaxID=118200 RepID=UPI0023BA2034|nr:N-acetylneuraminate lyase isoform X2 [Dryobates pubescens]